MFVHNANSCQTCLMNVAVAMEGESERQTYIRDTTTYYSNSRGRDSIVICTTTLFLLHFSSVFQEGEEELLRCISIINILVIAYTYNFIE